MTKAEFNAEWFDKIKSPWDLTIGANWYTYASSNVHKLSPMALDFILSNQNEFGDWLIEAAAWHCHGILEEALGLEVI